MPEEVGALSPFRLLPLGGFPQMLGPVDAQYTPSAKWRWKTDLVGEGARSGKPPKEEIVEAVISVWL